MKSTGIVRKIDDLGRIVLPKELRKLLGIEERDPIEIFIDGSTIMLQKHQATCVFCGSSENLQHFKGKNLCAACVKEITE